MPENTNMSFESSICYEQVTITPTAIVKESMEHGQYKATPMDATTFSFPLLSQEGADLIIIRRYSFMTGDEALDKRAVAAELKALGVTHVHPTDKGFIAYTLFDGGVARPFGDLRTISIANISEKMFKRLSLLNVMSYLNAYYDRDSVVIKFVDGVSGPHVDGEVYISKSFRRRVAKDMYHRVAKMDPAKALRLFKEAITAGTFNTGRILVAEGLIKGDFVVACDERMEGADVLAHTEDNLKPEVFLLDEDGLIVTMTPNKQAKSVRTNRQVLSLIGEHLLGKDAYLATDHFREKMEERLVELSSGQFVPSYRETPEVDGAIDGIIDKAHVWHKVFGTLSNSRYLTSMVVGQWIRQHTPTNPLEDDRKRRLPIPFARSYSIRSEHSYEMMYGKKCPVKPGHIYLDKRLGAVAANDILVEVLEIAGGADLDDKVSLHYRIIEGMIQAIVIRDPMTADADVDGKTVGLEYQIRPVHGYGINTRRGTAHGFFVPVWDASAFPRTVAQITPPEESLTATPRTFPAQYSNEYAWEVVQANTKDSFGGFANLLMAFVNVGIAFPFVAKGETLIDICQQSRNPIDLDRIAKYVNQLRKVLVERLVDGEIEIDRHIARRAGISKMMPKNLMTKGLFDVVISAHKQVVSDFEQAGAEIVQQITEDTRVFSLETVRHGGQNMAMGAWMAMVIRQERRAAGLDKKAETEAERNVIGDHLASFFEAKIDNGTPRDAVLGAIRQMFLWAHREDALQDEMAEKVLYWGGMFHLLVEALSSGPGKVSAGSPSPTPATPNSDAPAPSEEEGYFEDVSADELADYED